MLIMCEQMHTIGLIKISQVRDYIKKLSRMDHSIMLKCTVTFPFRLFVRYNHLAGTDNNASIRQITFSGINDELYFQSLY